MRNPAGGQTLLTLTLLIGSIVVMASVVFVAVALSLASSGYAFRTAETAEAAATAGVEDAMLRLTRNAGFASVGYSVPVGAWTASVSVAQSSPAAGYVTAVSAVTVSNVTRKLSALFSENTTTGQVNLISVQTIQ